MSNNVSGIEISSNTQTDMHNDVHRELETETLPEDTNHEPSAYTEVVGLQANKKPWESSQKTTTSAATENILYQWLKEKDPDLFKVLGNKQFDPNLGNIVRRSSDIEDHDNYDITETLFTNQITNDVNKVFLIVLLVCIVGEALASPMEKLLDDTFFGYLDDVDNTEKYGQQKLWSLLGYVVWGATISIIIENSPCFLNFNISNYMIHFYGFAAMMGLAFLIVLFFPMQSTPSKEHGQNKLLKCVKLLCSDSFNIAYVTSMFLAGVINASKFSFLFWFLADMGSSDLPLGLSVSMSAVMQIPMLCLYPWFTKKITQAGVMTISLASMSIQYVYYSFLWTPWAVVPIEILSAFSIASLQLSALSHAESTSPPGLDRLLQHIFWTMYWQIGFSIGSIVSGVIYQTFSPQVLFRSASLLALFWALGFLIIMRYAPRSKRRMSYSRLLQKRDDLEDDIDDSDEDGGDVFSDDWLVNALKKDLD
uniref:Major facilitator superfamily domain-containing protein 6-like protein B-like n=1 Tax=Saccoglossus kowalevskii TaxID=10224 RepID=A0ABM0GJ50_SACKO|nr:PREDICTED: major facilitator superfamily domain-containing protein 6-like protein B-like [Saccoglossus kowalevskii]